MIPTDYHAILNSFARDLVEHGWGEMVFKVQTLKGNEQVKVIVECGRSYTFIINKRPNKHNDII